MSDVLNGNFPVSKDSYLAFDGLTIKDKIKQRLNQTGIFTDQNFEGSNLAAFNDAFAMGMSLLVYMLNKNVVGGQFSETQIYENMNRVVKQLDYKPVGHQTSNLAFGLSAQTLDAGIYTIPRYTSINVGGVSYSINKDISFVKAEDTVLEPIPTVGDNNLLFQGAFLEFPTYTAAGNDNEIMFLTVNDDVIVDNFNIDVYVKSGEKWEKWEKTASLYLNNSLEKVYELRFNENKRYEIKFGNDINGKKLTENDLVALYYLRSDGVGGEIGANTLFGIRPSVFSTIQFNQILSDTAPLNTNILNDSNGLQYLTFDNSCVSSNYTEPETVQQIRTNAPNVFRSQFSLGTQNSYETFVRTNFSNIVQDVKVKNNTEFLDSYIKYFYDLGLTKPQLESRALFNQMKFADSCNFNNVYIFTVPKTVANNLSYLYPAQKSLIIDSIQEQKTLTSEPIVMDPVYLTLDIALSETNTTLIDDVDQSEIFIQPNFNSRRSSDSIINDVNNIINNFFNRKNTKLGQTIDINDLTNQILGVEGVKKIFTRRTDTGYMVEGLRFIIWNPIYEDLSSSVIVGNTTLEDFQFPYLFRNDFTNKISVDDSFVKFEKTVI